VLVECVAPGRCHKTDDEPIRLQVQLRQTLGVVDAQIVDRWRDESQVGLGQRMNLLVDGGTIANATTRRPTDAAIASSATRATSGMSRRCLTVGRLCGSAPG
jgi:hypothetical protein